MDGDRLFQPIGNRERRLRGSVFKVEYRLRPCLSTAIQRNAAPWIRWPWRREKLKITEMRIPSKGEIVRTDTAYPGEIVILADDTLKLNDILGNENSCLIKHGLIIPCHLDNGRAAKSEQRALLNALRDR